MREVLKAGAVAATAAAVLGVGAGIVLALRTGKWFARTTAPDVLDGLGTSVGFGIVSGAVVMAAALAAWKLSERASGGPPLRRSARLIGVSVCTALAFCPVMYLLAALPGRNCPSFREGCEYIPGSGPALSVCVATVALAGWATYRVHTTRTERRRAQERERMRRLRKKGKGKSRKGM
ncbi:hypothetical protein [Streptomyces sp. NPDC014006]|uniref:hypothetical protein n=1 Tax=Streptomyces sp. NPDC014006 TaxID=3364870 RepID=UPI0036F526C9